MTSPRMTSFRILFLCFGIALVGSACEAPAPHSQCPDCPSGFFCGPDGECHKPCNIVAECDVCEMCSEGLCMPKVGCTEGNEQACSQDKTCDNPNQICVNDNGDLVCTDKTEIQFRPGTFESTQPNWETKEYVIRGNVAPIIGTSRCDDYAVRPNNH